MTQLYCKKCGWRELDGFVKNGRTPKKRVQRYKCTKCGQTTQSFPESPELKIHAKHRAVMLYFGGATKAEISGLVPFTASGIGAFLKKLRPVSEFRNSKPMRFPPIEDIQITINGESLDPKSVEFVFIETKREHLATVKDKPKKRKTKYLPYNSNDEENESHIIQTRDSL